MLSYQGKTASETLNIIFYMERRSSGLLGCPLHPHVNREAADPDPHLLFTLTLWALLPDSDTLGMAPLLVLLCTKGRVAAAMTAIACPPDSWSVAAP